MTPKNRHKLAFVLVATDQSTMIVNRQDYHQYRQGDPSAIYGLGYQILETGSFDPQEVDMLKKVLSHKKEKLNRPIIALDCGANIGVHTVNLAKHMTNWGYLMAFEAQERVFYALAGNVALNNCFNATVMNVALADKDGVMNIPVLDHTIPSSFGSLELVQRPGVENIGQHIPFERMQPIRTVAIDSFEFQNLDFIKMDIEGMEMQALTGAVKTIEKYKPFMFIENIKCGHQNLVDFLTPYGYVVKQIHANTVAMHIEDPVYIDDILNYELQANWVGIE